MVPEIAPESAGGGVKRGDGPAYWPWARILFACLAALALAVALLLLFGGSADSSGGYLLLSNV